MTQRLNEYEARLRDPGEVLKLIPTVQEQIAYLKGRITKKKPETREKREILT